MSVPGPDDSALLLKFQNGDQGGLESLVERHQGGLLRFAGGLLRDPSRAEDAVQETFLRLIRKAPRLGTGDSLGPWLFRVCRNLSLDTRKIEGREMERRRRLETRGGVDSGSVTARPQDNPSQVAEDSEVRSLVDRELELLPERERTALRLKVHGGLSYAEVAEVLQVKPGTVGWLIHKGMDRLASRLRAAQAI